MNYRKRKVSDYGWKTRKLDLVLISNLSGLNFGKVNDLLLVKCFKSCALNNFSNIYTIYCVEQIVSFGFNWTH